MSVPLTILRKDNLQLLELKERIGAKSKVAVLRMALTLLEKDIDKQERIKRWKTVTKIVAESSSESLSGFSIPVTSKDLP